MDLATLANLAPGRLLAGIGHGVQDWMEQMGARTSSPVTTLDEVITELDESPVTLHLCDVKGPVRDVLRRAGIWERLDGRLHATAHQAVEAVEGHRPESGSLRDAGIDERGVTTGGVPSHA